MVGIVFFPRLTQGDSLSQQLTQLAQTAEAQGMASVWIAEDPQASAATGYDPVMMQSWMGRVTSTLPVGVMGEALVLHSAAVRAKQIATADWYSRGRFQYGLDLRQVPAGLADPLRQGEVEPVSESIDKYAAMQALWTQNRAHYDGTHAKFAGAIALPKPYQQRNLQAYLTATTAAHLQQFVDTCGTPAGWISWLADHSEFTQDTALLQEVLGDDAGAVRRIWVTPVDAAVAATAAAPDADILAFFDHIPTAAELTELAGKAA